MIKVNGKLLCSCCFAEVKGKRCSECNEIHNTDKYPTSLADGGILAGRYAVGRVLGKGGFGITYLCYDLRDDERVAIKEYLPSTLALRNPGETRVTINGGDKVQSFKDGAQKFFDEAKTVSKFNGNPNIIGVKEFFYENDTAYFVMEYLDGQDFKSYVNDHGKKVNPDEVVYIIDKIINALMIVHSQGILHRDISPDNIFICEDGGVKLIDFGAARQLLGEASQSLSVILKQNFAPIEQYQRKGRQGPWTDIYALGATMYYALTGKVLDDAMSRLDDSAVDYTGIPEDVALVLDKMLAVNYNERYQDTITLKRDLGMLSVGMNPPKIIKKEKVVTQAEESKSAHREKSKTVKKKTYKGTDISTGLSHRPTESKKSTGAFLEFVKKNVKVLSISVAAFLVVVTATLLIVLLPKGDETPEVLPAFNTDIVETQDTPATVVTQSKFGASLSYELYDNGTLVISGSGAMPDWSDAKSTPWYAYSSDIKSVTVNKGVTVIGSNAFASCSSLTSISIPDTVTKIGDNAFLYCASLSFAILPKSITTIGNGSFSYCEGLKSLTIPEGVETVGNDAFYYCKELTSITIPSTVESIGSNAFYNCKGLTAITIPEGVSTIGDEAFSHCENLKTVSLSKSLDESKPVAAGSGLGSGVFAGCKKLESVSIPKAITQIGKNAFSNCSALTSVTLPSGITTIGDSSFEGCSRLTAITLPDSVVTVGNGAFKKCTELTSVTLSAGTASIGAEAFSGCTKIKSISIPHSVTYIGNNAFSAWTSEQTIRIEYTWYTDFGNYQWHYECEARHEWPNIIITEQKPTEQKPAEQKPIQKPTEQKPVQKPTEQKPTEQKPTTPTVKKLLEGKCGDGLTFVLEDTGKLTISGKGAMDNWTSSASTPWTSKIDSIKTVVINDGATNISPFAFQNCTSITSVSIPKSVTLIDVRAFENCTSLTSLTIPNGVVTIAKQAFYGCKAIASEIILPRSVTSIGNDAFRGCVSIPLLKIPEEVTSIGKDAFRGWTAEQKIECERNTQYTNGWKNQCKAKIEMGVEM